MLKIVDGLCHCSVQNESNELEILMSQLDAINTIDLNDIVLSMADESQGEGEVAQKWRRSMHKL